ARGAGVTWHRALWSPDFPRHPHPSRWADDATVRPAPPRPLSHARSMCVDLPVLVFMRTMRRRAAGTASRPKSAPDQGGGCSNQPLRAPRDACRLAQAGCDSVEYQLLISPRRSALRIRATLLLTSRARMIE